MQPLIEPRHYRDIDILKAELESIFSHCWIFAGFKGDIPKENDWFTTRIGQCSVIVQNCGDEIRAFLNVCSHRFSQICTQPKGSGSLRCPYHGWQYDQQGMPSAIPRRPRFAELNEEMIRNLALVRYQTEICGNLIFLRRNTEGPSLAVFLGETYMVLEAVSLSLDKTIDCTSQTIQANWKINVENTLESYHVGCVHGETFAKAGWHEIAPSFYGIHSGTRGDFGEKTSANWNAVKSRFVSACPQDGYSHLFIFPNLLIAGSYGLSFVFSTFSPDSPVTSTFNNRLFQVRLLEGSLTGSALLETMMDSVKDFNRRVFDEDAVICQTVQKGVNQTNGKGILSDEEARVCSFHKAYLELSRTGKQSQPI